MGSKKITQENVPYCVTKNSINNGNTEMKGKRFVPVHPSFSSSIQRKYAQWVFICLKYKYSGKPESGTPFQIFI